jgi:hypothetical protein
MVAWRRTGGKRNFIVFLSKAIAAFARAQPKNRIDKKERVGEETQSNDSMFDMRRFANGDGR